MVAISKYIGVTGRVDTFLNQPEKGTMSVSCTMYKYDNNEPVYNLLKYLSVALRGGAGICVNLDDFVTRPKQNKTFSFYLPDTHPDYADLSPSQLQRWDYVGEAIDKGDTVIINVADSMEEDSESGCSIQRSWELFIELLESDKAVILDLSQIRPKGTTNTVGLTASGATSFLTIYEAILNFINEGDIVSLMQMCGQMNEVLRRGGSYKNGIVTFTLVYTHPNIVKYLNVPLAIIPGSGKKGVIIDKGLLSDRRLKKLIEVRVNDKSVMLEKTIYKCRKVWTGEIVYKIGEELSVLQQDMSIEVIQRLYSQVCKEITFTPKSTCLLSHVNLGQITLLDELEVAFTDTANLLVYLWKTWKQQVGDKASQYLPMEEDKQVGMGVFGLANLLSHLGITYSQHIRALEAYLSGGFYPRNTIEFQLAIALDRAYQGAAKIFREAGLERGFTIAPTQSCAYRYTDLRGNTTAKNLNPPLAKRVRRTSHTVAALAGFYYHGEIETIQSIIEKDGVGIIQRLWEAWQKLMNRTGLAHCMSFDLYTQIDAAWLEDFLVRSPLVTTYYMVSDKIDQSYLNKGLAVTATTSVKDADFCAIDNPGGCASCAE